MYEYTCTSISKFTKSYTPWMQDMDIKPLRNACHKARHKSSQTNSDHDRQTYVKLRNQLK